MTISSLFCPSPSLDPSMVKIFIRATTTTNDKKNKVRVRISKPLNTVISNFDGLGPGTFDQIYIGLKDFDCESCTEENILWRLMS